MGKISILTEEQKKILDDLNHDQYFLDNFYFTGGTALSEFYLQHRYSEDMDFFTKQKFDNEAVLGMMHELGKKYHFKYQSRFVEVVYRFELSFPNNTANSRPAQEIFPGKSQRDRKKGCRIKKGGALAWVGD